MKVLIAEDQVKVRFGLHILLKQQPDLQVVGEAIDRETLENLVRSMQPNLILLDWNLPGITLREIIPLLKEACPGVHIITLSERQECRKAVMEAGSDAFAFKADPPDKLLSVISEL